MSPVTLFQKPSSHGVLLPESSLLLSLDETVHIFSSGASTTVHFPENKAPRRAASVPQDSRLLTSPVTWTGHLPLVSVPVHTCITE